MKMYLNSQYHIDPPSGRTRSARAGANSTQRLLARPHDAGGSRRILRGSDPRRTPVSTTIGMCSVAPVTVVGLPAFRAGRRRARRAPVDRRVRRRLRFGHRPHQLISATLCSAITVSSGCCSPLTSAASAHTGHHTCWQRPGPRSAPPPSPPPRAPRGPADPGSPGPARAVRARYRRAGSRRSASPVGHTCGSGRNRTVSSLPRSAAPITDAAPQHGRQPHPAAQAGDTDDQVVPGPAEAQRAGYRPVANPAACRYIASSARARLAVDDRPQRARRRRTVAAADLVEQLPQRLGADRFAGQVRCQHQLGRRRWCRRARREPHCCSAIRCGVPVEGGMFGQVAVLVRIILKENLIDDQLRDPHPHQGQRAEGADRLGRHHPFGGEDQVRAAPGRRPAVSTAIPRRHWRPRPGRPRPAARIVDRRAEPAVARPAPLDVHRRTPRAGSASAVHRRSRHSPPPRSPTGRRRQAGPPTAVRAPPGCPGTLKVLRAQRSPRSEDRETGGQHRGGRAPRGLQQGQGVQCQCVEVPAAGVAAVLLGEDADRTRRPAPGSTGAPSTSPSECAWSVETTSTRCPLSAARTAVAEASVDLPTPPLPTKKLIRARAHRGGTSALDPFLQVLQGGVGQPALGLALEQTDHRDHQVDRQLVGDLGAGAVGGQSVGAVEGLEQRSWTPATSAPTGDRPATRT